MITDRLFALAESNPDAAFLEWDERTIGFAEMSRLVSAYARRLEARGIREGQHVALLCGNRPAFLVAWFALTELGAVTVPLNTGLVGDGLRYSLTQSEAVALIIEPDLLAEKQGDLERLSAPLPVVPIDETVETDDGSASERLKRGSGAPDALGMILYTSGTTGLPKGAMIANEAFLLAGRDMSRSLALTSRDRIMVFLPLFHANPQMYAVSSALAVGATLILLQKFSASDFLDVARRHGATGFTYVGTVLSILDKRNPEPDRDHELRFAVGGGAPALVWRSLEEKFGFTVNELYGMTETGGWVSMNTSRSRRFGTVGSARNSVSLRVVDDRDADVAAGEKGQIIARSSEPNLMFAGYWKKPDITAEMMAGGWLHTGDRGWLDADGFLSFDGRLKELIRRGGEMISPQEIELQLLKHPAVRDCAVVGVPDDIMGEEIQAVVVGEKVEAAALRDFLSGQIARHMLPRYFVFADAIPKTETQKIKRHELVQARLPRIDLQPARTARG